MPMRLRLSPSWRCRCRSSIRRQPTHGPSHGLASIVVVAVAVGPPRWALRHDHRWGGAVGSALVRMLLDDTTAASASDPDSGGTQAIISIPCRRLRTAGARKPSFPSPAAAVIAFERAVSRQLPHSAAVGRPAATMASGK